MHRPKNLNLQKIKKKQKKSKLRVLYVKNTFKETTKRRNRNRSCCGKPAKKKDEGIRKWDAITKWNMSYCQRENHEK